MGGCRPRGRRASPWVNRPGKFRMSKRSVQGLLAGFCSVTVGLGSISKMEQAVSAAVAPAVEAAEARVRAQAVVHLEKQLVPFKSRWDVKDLAAYLKCSRLWVYKAAEKGRTLAPRGVSDLLELVVEARRALRPPVVGHNSVTGSNTRCVWFPYLGRYCAPSLSSADLPTGQEAGPPLGSAFPSMSRRYAARRA